MRSTSRISPALTLDRPFASARNEKLLYTKRLSTPRDCIQVRHRPDLRPENDPCLRGTSILLAGLLLLLSPPSAPVLPNTGILGDWVASDKSIVRIYHCDAAICLKIVYIDPAIGHTTDGLNHDAAKRGQPLCELVIGTGFQPKSPVRAEGGKLYDPESGNTYSGTLALDGAKLRLHGYIGIAIFGRTEDWQRAPAGHPVCH